MMSRHDLFRTSAAHAFALLFSRSLFVFFALPFARPRAFPNVEASWAGGRRRSRHLRAILRAPASFIWEPQTDTFSAPKTAGDTGTFMGSQAPRATRLLRLSVVDPRHSGTLFASTWTREEHGEGGGVFRSADGGKTWRDSGLPGHAVRALVAAPSDPDTLVAGALDGVFRSRDAGKNWEMITPAGDPELRNFDSLAIDPRNPEIIYAGTFHLPWKTTDGGQDWTAIHKGMIDDSDVLSLAVNPSNPEQIFASACSGIYGSDDAGMHWKRIQGIPDSSRRTLVIRFDPANQGTLYAGTTEGLWKSTDSGAHWRRVSPDDWVINSLAVVPAEDGSAASRILIGTEQQGVLVSGSATGEFESANDGFEHRRVVSLTLDRENPGHLGAVLANASDPVIQTNDGGETWSPLGSGLESGTVRRLFSTPEGWWAAVASGGLMRLDATTGKWIRAGISSIERGQGRLVSRLGLVRGLRKFSGDSVSRFRERPFFQQGRHLVRRNRRRTVYVRTMRALRGFRFLSRLLTLPVNSVRVSADGKNVRIVSSHGMVFSDDAGPFLEMARSPAGILRCASPGSRRRIHASRDFSYRSLYVPRCWSDVDESPGRTTGSRRLTTSCPAGFLGRVSSRKPVLYLSRDRGDNWSRIEPPAGSAEPDYFPVLEAGFCVLIASMRARRTKACIFSICLGRRCWRAA